MISSKGHLSYLELHCSSSGSMESSDEIERQQQQQVVEEVFQNLCPPSCIQNLTIEGYFGRRLPNWLMETTTFKSLRFLILEDLPCCTQLPDGLCRLPCLEVLNIADAPAIKRVRPEFQGSFSALALGGVITATSAAFPNLTTLGMKGLCEWEEWDWEEDVSADAMAMPALKKLIIYNCNLSCLPLGLANGKRHALKILYLYELTNLTYVDNFPWVVELDVRRCVELKRISGLSRLQKARIYRCPNLEVLEDVPLLDSLELSDATMKTLPAYLRGITPRYLDLACSMELAESLKPGSTEWDKISHIEMSDIGYTI